MNVGSSVQVGVAVAVGVSVNVGSGVQVGVAVAVGVSVNVGSSVQVGVAVSDGTGVTDTGNGPPVTMVGSQVAVTISIRVTTIGGAGGSVG